MAKDKTPKKEKESKKKQKESEDEAEKMEVEEKSSKKDKSSKSSKKDDKPSKDNRKDSEKKKEKRKRDEKEEDSDEDNKKSEDASSNLTEEEKKKREARLAKTKRRKEMKKLQKQQPTESSNNNKNNKGKDAKKSSNKEDQSTSQDKPQKKKQKTEESQEGEKKTKKKKQKKNKKNEEDEDNPEMDPTESSKQEAIEAREAIQLAKKNKNIFAFNKLISAFGQKKRLGFALEAYNVLISVYQKTNRIQPTVYTYTNLINACVRCGEVQRAKNFLNEMRKQKVDPNEVTYTALIKGLCGESSGIEEACHLLDEMIQNEISPNIRTYNTILRGCLKNGELDVAKKIFIGMKNNGIEPDISSFEYLVKNLCQALKLTEAWDLTNEMKKRGIYHAPAFAAIATSSAIKGDLEGAKKALNAASSALQDPTSMDQYQSSYDQSGYLNNDYYDEQSGKGGQQYRASLPLFLKLRNEEVERECERVEDYIKKVELKKIKISKLSFPDPDHVMFLPSQKTKKFNLNLKFKDTNKPLRLEICSGHGDWIVERAEKDKESNWVGLEMKYERVYLIWSKMIFRGLDNMLILGGEAHAILRESVANELFDEVFVNYPDPPVWEGSKQRLIDKPFLKYVHRSLKDGCALTIVTDDEGYCQQMVQQFEQVKDIFRSAFGVDMFVENVPEGYGSSYFDRLWTNGNKTRRFYLKYYKI